MFKLTPKEALVYAKWADRLDPNALKSERTKHAALAIKLDWALSQGYPWKTEYRVYPEYFSREQSCALWNCWHWFVLPKLHSFVRTDLPKRCTCPAQMDHILTRLRTASFLFPPDSSPDAFNMVVAKQSRDWFWDGNSHCPHEWRDHLIIVLHSMRIWADRPASPLLPIFSDMLTGVSLVCGTNLHPTVRDQTVRFYLLAERLFRLWPGEKDHVSP